MKTLVYAAIGTGALFLGILGLVVPLIPGVLFLLVAAAAFAAISPRVRRRLSTHPRMERYFHHMDAGDRLDIVSRAKLAFWATLDALNPNHQHRGSRVNQSVHRRHRRPGL